VTPLYFHPERPNHGSPSGVEKPSEHPLHDLPNPEPETEHIKLGYLLLEKCELRRAKPEFLLALDISKKSRNLRGVMEALVGLLRLAGVASDLQAVESYERELDQMMMGFPDHVPSLAWYCKGIIVLNRGQFLLAQRYFHRFLREVRNDPAPVMSSDVWSPEEREARGWLSLALTLHARGRIKRAEWMVNRLLTRFEHKKLKSINGTLYMIMSGIAEMRGDFDLALEWNKKAHAAFMQEHNWYYYLRVLWAYARIARGQENFVQAYWYLDLVSQAIQAQEFGDLRIEIAKEREKLQNSAVDILVNCREGTVTTREGGVISLRKQHVLLHMLDELSKAHQRSGEDPERGLSKAEMIQYVWKENYRPEVHDNKLYYNINRIRKLIETDTKNPKYLLNWKEGYRLAPGLRVQVIGATSPQTQRAEKRVLKVQSRMGGRQNGR
jgi:hypothetical protein